MMKQEKYYSYISFDEKRFKYVKIPYKLPNYNMLIILPDKRFGLKDLILKLDFKTIEELKIGKNFIRKKSC